MCVFTVANIKQLLAILRYTYWSILVLQQKQSFADWAQNNGRYHAYNLLRNLHRQNIAAIQVLWHFLQIAEALVLYIQLLSFEHCTYSWFKKSNCLISSIVFLLYITDASALWAKRHLLWGVWGFHSCYFYAKSQRVLTFALQRYSFFLIYARKIAFWGDFYLV